MSTKLLIYLADLDHFDPGNRVSVPYSVASIKSYCNNFFSKETDIRLFKDPNKLMKAVTDNPPHILGLSYYMWNERLTQHVAECSKKINQNIITVIGGPSVARDSDAYKNILLLPSKPIDVIVLDQGEKSFANIIKAVLTYGKDKKKCLAQGIDGCAICQPETHNILRGDLIRHKVGLGEIPSPYLKGYLDEFLSDGMLATFETVRGCPYACTFCGAGDPFYNKLIIRDEAVVYEELLYIRKRTKRPEIDLIDTNFGILKDRDQRIINYMLKMHRETGFPHITAHAITKNQTKETIPIMKAIAEMAGNMTFAVQTLTEEVLINSKRKNISLEAMRELAEFSRKNSLPMLADAIFGLPGETYSSYMETLYKLASMGVKSPEIYQLRLLSDSEVANKQRSEFKYKGLFRPIANRMGEYNFLPGEKPVRIVELEEIAVSTKSFSFDDYLKIREYSLLLTIFLRQGTFTDTVSFLSTKGITITDLIIEVQSNKKTNSALSKFLDEYRLYAKGEFLTDDSTKVEEMVKDDSLWKDLSSSAGKFFKLNFGFAGYCLFENLEILRSFEHIINNYVSKKLSETDMNDFQEVIKYDKLHLLIQNHNGSRLNKNNIREEIIIDEYFDYNTWKDSNFEKSLSKYRLKKPIKKLYKVPSFSTLIDWTDKLSNLETYNYYDRIIRFVPEGFSRRYSVTYKN